MKELDVTQLMTVTGGRRTNIQLQLALSQLSRDLKDLANPTKNPMTEAMNMMVMALLLRR